jgi:hypothetical protein
MVNEFSLPFSVRYVSRKFDFKSIQRS